MNWLLTSLLALFFCTTVCQPLTSSLLEEFRKSSVCFQSDSVSSEEKMTCCCPHSIVMIFMGPPHLSLLSVSLTDKHMSHKDEAGRGHISGWRISGLGQKCSSSCSQMWPRSSGSSLQLYHLPNCDSSSEWQDVLPWVPLRGPVRGQAPPQGSLATGRIPSATKQGAYTHALYFNMDTFTYTPAIQS